MANVYPTPERVGAFLSDCLGEPATVERYERITGGYSRYMAKCWLDDGRGFIVRSDPPAGESIIDTDRTLEWKVLNAVHEAGGVRLPTPRFFDETGEAVGAPTILIDLIDGDSLFSHFQDDGPDERRQYTRRLAELAAELHTFDAARLPAELARPQSWDGYIDQVVERWRRAEAELIDAEPFMRLVASWLDSHRPPPAPLTMVHGDFQSPNIVVDAATGEFNMVDWELTEIGDPRQDLGWWVLACKSQPPDLIEEDADAFFSAYRDLTGLSEEIVNPATVAYFTVLASVTIFTSVMQQTEVMTRGDTTSPSIAYMTNAVPFMHGVWIDAMRTAGGWSEGSAA